MRAFVHRVDGIDWYCEQRGDGPAVVLIPAGEGDCGSYETVAAELADQFTVLTFDMPGFSRTRASDADISMQKIASQIASLVTALGIRTATFYGCSSGGVAALDLAIHHAPIVRNAIVHEAAIGREASAALLGDLVSLGDAEIIERCKMLYGLLNDDQAAWEALGADYHARVESNYPTWVHRYVAAGPPEYSPSDLAEHPITWTIGGLNPAAAFFDNVVLAAKADLPISVLMCKHFPHVSIPAVLAAHIRAATLEHLNRDATPATHTV